MVQNPVLFALITYGLTLLIALAVAGIITIIHMIVQKTGKPATEADK